MSEKSIHFCPDYSISPGEILAEALEGRGWSAADLAVRCQQPLMVVDDILGARAPLTAELAAVFERILDIKATLWLNLERQYRQQSGEYQPPQRIAGE